MRLIDSLRKISDDRALIFQGVASAQEALLSTGDVVVATSKSIVRARGLDPALALLPYWDTTSMTMELVEQLAVRKARPLVAGVCAFDPYLEVDMVVRRLADLGCDGVVASPTAGEYGSGYSDYLDSQGLGFGRELSVLAEAKRVGLLTVARCTTREQVKEAAGAGVDCVMLSSTAEVAESLPALVEWSVKSTGTLVLCEVGEPLEAPRRAQLWGAHGQVTDALPSER